MQPLSEMDPAVLKHVRGETLSPKEAEIVKNWRSQSPERDQLLKDFESGAPWIVQEVRNIVRLDFSDIWHKVVSELTAEGAGPFPDAAPVLPLPQTSKRLWKIVGIAACAIALIGLVITTIRRMNHHPAKPIASTHRTNTAADIQPGANKATLTLADGRRIVLDPTRTGPLASQGNMTVSIETAGQVRYSPSTTPKTSSAPLYNTLATPRAGQFTLVLPDGSHVWLNNVSSLRYPIIFTGNSREVELRGEACFEVTRDESRPFKVHILKGAQPTNESDTVEVLGTSFNIKAYDDEDTIYTTLAKGKITFHRNGNDVTLLPGDQSVLTGKVVDVHHNVDTTIAMAWKDGNFNFHHADLESTMRQLARWYDVKVEYQGKITGNYAFQGSISRSLTLQQILDNLGKYGVHAHLEGRKIIVLP